MIGRGIACRYAMTSSSVFKLNQTCFVKSPLKMRHDFLSSTRKPSAREALGSFRRLRNRKKQDNQSLKTKSCWSRSSMSDIVQCEFLPQGQAINQQGDPATNTSHRELEETRQIVATSLWQCTFLQWPEYPTVPVRDEHRSSRTTPLCNFFFIFSKLKGRLSRRNWGAFQKNPPSSA